MKAESRFRFGRMATAGALIAGSLFAGQAAFACTVDNWSQNSGNVTPGDPGDGIARYSGLCAMQAPDGTAGYVQDNNPGGINRIIARFYLLADNSSTAHVYRGFDSGSTQLFNVSVGTGGNVTLSSGGDSVTSSNAVNGMWNSIEIDWNAGADEVSLSVNGETFQSVNVGLSGALDFVRLGNLNGATGTLNFDSYESRRSTFVGRLCVGDGTGDGSIGFPDVTTIFNEVSSAGVELASGQPDVDEDGSVGFPDVTQAFNLVSIAASCD